jgi:multicomponent Na+:H+ antiporter subunit D
MSAAVVWMLLLPFTGAVLAVLAGGRLQRLAAGAVVVATPVAGFLLAVSVWRTGPQRYMLGGWDAPLGIGLYTDGLGAFMLLATSVVAVMVSLYGFGYYRASVYGDAREARLFWPLWLFLWAGMNALFLTADIFNAYVVFELIGLAAIGLVTISGAGEALTAATRYLIVTFLGSLSYLMGVALLYAAHGTLDIVQLSHLLEAEPSAFAAFALIAAGLMLKTALFPMHFWLPPAHASAAAPVSALLSALVVKVSFFMLVRLWFTVFRDVATYPAGTLLGVLGCIAILWGSFQAIRQKKLKLLIAHSTVAQVGLLFLLFPLMTVPEGVEMADWGQEAWTGVLYQVLSHALAKAALFLAAGVVLRAYATDSLADLGGLFDHMPLTTITMAIAGMSLMGLPPSGGFAAKWLIMKAAITSGQWWWLPVIVLGGLLTAGYVALIIRHTFKAAEKAVVLGPVSRSMEIAAFALAVLAILVGFRLEEPFHLLTIGAPLAPEMNP